MASESSKIISPGKVVAIHFVLRDEQGSELDDSSGGEPIRYLHGAGNIVSGLEEGLTGKRMGEKVHVQVTPENGFGVRDPRGVQKVSRDTFPDDVEIFPGMEFGAEDEDGESVPVWVTAVEGDQLTIDFNHPLAGKTLHFDVVVAEVRDATAEEIEHGHPHGPGGEHD
jgi:FKBP-type peptidyl-prolyl cis-trans isomerase SlyD